MKTYTNILTTTFTADCAEKAADEQKLSGLKSLFL